MKLKEVRKRITELRKIEQELLIVSENCNHRLRNVTTEEKMIPLYRLGTTGKSTNTLEKVYFIHGYCSKCGKEIYIRDNSWQYKKH